MIKTPSAFGTSPRKASRRGKSDSEMTLANPASHVGFGGGRRRSASAVEVGLARASRLRQAVLQSAFEGKL